MVPLGAGRCLWRFFGLAGRRYRIMGWSYLVLLSAFIMVFGKTYYVTPIYPMLFAAGAIGFEEITARRFAWSRIVYVAAIVVVGALLTPISCPILSPEVYVRYQAALHIQPPAAERQNNGPLPQYFADEFGWEEMVQQVARVYDSLSPKERAQTAIFSNSWGDAPALAFYAPRDCFAAASIKSNNYWI